MTHNLLPPRQDACQQYHNMDYSSLFTPAPWLGTFLHHPALLRLKGIRPLDKQNRPASHTLFDIAVVACNLVPFTRFVYYSDPKKKRCMCMAALLACIGDLPLEPYVSNMLPPSLRRTNYRHAIIEDLQDALASLGLTSSKVLKVLQRWEPLYLGAPGVVSIARILCGVQTESDIKKTTVLKDLLKVLGGMDRHCDKVVCTQEAAILLSRYTASSKRVSKCACLLQANILSQKAKIMGCLDTLDGFFHLNDAWCVQGVYPMDESCHCGRRCITLRGLTSIPYKSMECYMDDGTYLPLENVLKWRCHKLNS